MGTSNPGTSMKALTNQLQESHVVPQFSAPAVARSWVPDGGVHARETVHARHQVDGIQQVAACGDEVEDILLGIEAVDLLQQLGLKGGRRQVRLLRLCGGKP